MRAPPTTIGIDLGGSKLAAGLVDADGALLQRRVTARPTTSELLADALVEVVSALLTPSVAAVGMGVAGLVAWPAEFVWGPHLSGVTLPFRKLLAEAVDLPIVIDNDANAAGVAEARVGAAVGRRHVLMVTVGTGIGGGIVYEGRPFRGRSFAGEFGHMVIDVGGLLCACGQRGCWETLASGRRLDGFAKELAADQPTGLVAELADGEHPVGRHLTEAAGAGDEDARARVDEVGRWMGVGFANLIAIFDPDVIVVGGGLSPVLGMLLPVARRAVVDNLEGSRHRAPTPIEPAALGPDAGLVGSALLAADEIDE